VAFIFVLKYQAELGQVTAKYITQFSATGIDF
jgi:hypothetical protein